MQLALKIAGFFSYLGNISLLNTSSKEIKKAEVITSCCCQNKCFQSVLVTRTNKQGLQQQTMKFLSNANTSFSSQIQQNACSWLERRNLTHIYKE